MVARAYKVSEIGAGQAAALLLEKIASYQSPLFFKATIDTKVFDSSKSNL